MASGGVGTNVLGDSADPQAANDDSLPPLSELPFLVTHWLANFRQPENEGDLQHEEAMERLRNATSEIAAAFSSLGAFGPSSRPTFRAMDMQPPTTNATYTDMLRRWQSVPPERLESLVQSAASATIASETVANRASTNLLLTAQESQPNADNGGRRLTEGPQASEVPTAVSILQQPALLGPSKDSNEVITMASRDTHELTLAVESDSKRLGKAASKAMREYLSLREEHEQAEVDIETLRKEVIKQQVLKDRLEKERAAILANGNAAAAQLESRLNQIAEGLLNTDRLIPQHMISLTRLEDLQRERVEKLSKAREVSQSMYSKLSSAMKRFRDLTRRPPVSVPVCMTACVPRENGSFFDSITRQYGGIWGPSLPKRVYGATPSDASASDTRKSILARRLTYAMTASAHLAFPVFCLCFDKTGRYFVTGADDCLVKLFYIGAARSNATTQRTFSYGSNERSAVLVCTLRGHAGVICDIDISADNAFLATASDDGDVRVWGLKDGVPIAILRGHKDGANMVSWSQLTPYRLVTTGSDGLARMWDVREAARNRYGAYIGKREDYTLPSVNNGRTTGDSEAAGASLGLLASGDELLPPLPPSSGDSAQLPGNVAGVAESNGQGAQNGANGTEGAGADNAQSGQFVQNDVLDDGVRLVTKLQHGAPPDQSLPGASTRTRRKAVRVICIARCPNGGHFVTGAEDGICRVWSEEDGSDSIAKQDAEHTATALFQAGQRTAQRRSTRAQQKAEGRLLAELTGHVNSITDLHYSHAGDRLLSASQKDGVARIWSWTESPQDAGGVRFENVRQILLQVKKPESMSLSGAPSRRRAGSNNASCDVAVWTADDAKIITSQCCLVKEGSAEIVDDSQYILVWDSRNGQCLLGISNAHTAQLPVLIPHPMIPSLLCSAGGDGIAKLWDLERGECLHLHENKILDIGPVSETNEQQRQNSGYLDGCFSPDGLNLVLTDDSGRFTLLSIADFGHDERSSDESPTVRRSSSSDQRIASWMKEQYFANDYYELYFDTNGYCVERGSGRPPHLAPRSARCSFTGTPWAEEVNDIFSGLAGPLPLSEDACRRARDEIRFHSLLSEATNCPENNRANLISYFDPLRTVLIDGKSGSVVSASDLRSVNETARRVPLAAANGGERHGGNQRSQSPGVRSLSSNYRWRGYEDIMNEEAAREEQEDADDDSYVNPPARLSAADEDLSDGFLMTDSESEEDNTRVTRSRANDPGPRSGRTRRRGRRREQALLYAERSRAMPTRVSLRQMNRSQPEHYEVESESDSFVEEYLSTNNTPTGPFVEDYTSAGHFFKLPDSGRVQRKWLLRTENKSSYSGVKNYAPQVGDSVVYIPRAHYETIKVFPTLDTPWKHFARRASWPVVRCTIKDIRYRFPYEQYYRSQNEARCLSVVAILTLQVTGIPALSRDGIFPWPRPNFVERQTRGEFFEVSMFESDCPEFVIPEALFTWRLQSIENAFGRTRHQNELPVIAYFSSEDANHLRSRPREDQEMDAFAGTLKRTQPNSEREPDVHLLNSGFGTLEVEWDTGELTSLSPWEVTLKDKAYETPDPPTLSETDSVAIAMALAKIEGIQLVEQYFLHPVDVSRYTDYLNRVEVPMDFSFIKERLAAGYYSNVLSVLSDARLIRDNCFKYNGPGELSEFASEVYDSFEEEIKRHVDIDESLVATSAPTVREDPNNFRALRDSSLASRFGGSEEGTMTLERLPMPVQRAGLQRTTSRRASENQEAEPSRRRTRSASALESVAAGRATRSGSSRSVLAMDAWESGDDDGYNDDDTSADRKENGGDSSEDLSETSSGEDSAPRRTSRRTGRKSTRRRDTRVSHRGKGKSNDSAVSSGEDWDEEQSDSSDDVEESDASPQPARRSKRLPTPESSHDRRPSTRRSTRASHSIPESSDALENGGRPRSRRTTRLSALDNDVADSPRRSNRARERKTMADLSQSDIDEEESEGMQEMTDGDSDEEEAPATERRRTVLKRRSHNTPEPAASKRRKPTVRMSPRRSGRSTRGTSLARSMADLSDSEVESSGGDDSSKEVKTAKWNTRKGRARKKRTRESASSKSLSPKRTRSEKSRESVSFPDLKSWPKIDIKDITKVTEAVLRHLSTLDEDGLFAAPVVEQVPDIKDEYLAQIETPMDFRTIEEERKQYYASIRELQEDLILVFRNCATFNEPSSVYHLFALTMWEQLNDVFRNVCNELDVMLPRRW